MKVAIYTVTDGKIVRVVDAPPCEVERQCRGGEDFYLNCPPSATHIIDNTPITLAAESTPVEILFAEIRRDRDVKLAASDKYMLPDFPITEETREQWRQYRQALRDMPETCDPENPIWPEMPV